MLWVASRRSWRTPWQFITDSLPYIAESLIVVALLTLIKPLISNPWLLIAVQTVTGISIYVLINFIAGSKIQKDLITYLRAHLKK